MRKQIGFLCFLLFILFLCGCGQAADTSGLAGTYRLVRTESEDVVLTDEMTDSFHLSLRFDPGGTGEIYNGETHGRLRWQLESDVLTVWAGSKTLTGTVKGTMLLLQDAESSSLLHFEMTEENAEPESEISEAKPELASAWVGDWYGWWKIEESSHDMPTSWYDCCAVIAYEGSCRRLTLWDEDGSFDEPLADILFKEDEDGNLDSLSGYFFGQSMREHDWSLKPTGGAFYVNRHEYRQNEEDFVFSIYLRPWGDNWEELEPSQLPFYFDDWYMPLIESGEAMPDHIPWQSLEQKRENP